MRGPALRAGVPAACVLGLALWSVTVSPSMSMLPLSDHITFPEAPQTGVCASCPGTCSSPVSFTLAVQSVLSWVRRDTLLVV